MVNKGIMDSTSGSTTKAYKTSRTDSTPMPDFGLANTTKNEVVAARRRHTESRAVFKQTKACEQPGLLQRPYT